MNELSHERGRRVAEAPDQQETGLDRKDTVSYHSLSALGRGSTENNANHATGEETSGDKARHHQ